MIKHKKIIISILLAYALFIVGIFNVRAESFVRIQQVEYTDPNQITMNISGTGGDYKNIRFSTKFNSQEANVVFIPATFTIASNDANQDGSDNVIKSIQFYMGGYACENVSSGFKCIVSPNTEISGEIVVYYGVTYSLNRNVSLDIFFDYNWWLYKDTSASSSEIAQNTSDINNSLNDSSIDTNNTSSSTTSWGNKNASNGTITNLLTLPISLLQAIVNGIQSSCSSFSLGSLFGTNINLPCINIGNLVGSALWSTIDILFSGFMILAIAKKLIKIFNDFTNLKTNQVDELYGGGK